jgi:hypothetical protein
MADSQLGKKEKEVQAGIVKAFNSEGTEITKEYKADGHIGELKYDELYPTLKYYPRTNSGNLTGSRVNATEPIWILTAGDVFTTKMRIFANYTDAETKTSNDISVGILTFRGIFVGIHFSEGTGDNTFQDTAVNYNITDILEFTQDTTSKTILGNVTADTFKTFTQPTDKTFLSISFKTGAINATSSYEVINPDSRSRPQTWSVSNLLCHRNPSGNFAAIGIDPLFIYEMESINNVQVTSIFANKILLQKTSAPQGFQGAQQGFQGAQQGFQGAQQGFQGAQQGVQGAQQGFQGAQQGFQGAQQGFPNGPPVLPAYRGGKRSNKKTLNKKRKASKKKSKSRKYKKRSTK